MDADSLQTSRGRPFPSNSGTSSGEQKSKPINMFTLTSGLLIDALIDWGGGQLHGSKDRRFPPRTPCKQAITSEPFLPRKAHVQVELPCTFVIHILLPRHRPEPAPGSAPQATLLMT